MSDELMGIFKLQNAERMSYFIENDNRIKRGHDFVVLQKKNQFHTRTQNTNILGTVIKLKLK